MIALRSHPDGRSLCWGRDGGAVVKLKNLLGVVCAATLCLSSVVACGESETTSESDCDADDLREFDSDCGYWDTTSGAFVYWWWVKPGVGGTPPPRWTPKLPPNGSHRRPANADTSARPSVQTSPRPTTTTTRTTTPTTTPTTPAATPTTTRTATPTATQTTEKTTTTRTTTRRTTTKKRR